VQTVSAGSEHACMSVVVVVVVLTVVLVVVPAHVFSVAWHRAGHPSLNRFRINTAVGALQYRASKPQLSGS